MSRDGPRPTGEQFPDAHRGQTQLDRLADTFLLLRPVALVVVVGALTGYLLQSVLTGVAVATALLAAIAWWRNIYLPRKAPPQ
jgi:hypothetical protein